MDDLFQGREVFNTGGKKDNVKLLIKSHASKIAMDKAQVGIIVKDPCGLLQLCEIDVQTCHPGIRDLRHQVGKPAIAAADVQHFERPSLTSQVSYQPPGGAPPA